MDNAAVGLEVLTTMEGEAGKPMAQDVSAPEAQQKNVSTEEAGTVGQTDYNHGESGSVVKQLASNIPVLEGDRPVARVNWSEIERIEGYTIAEKARTLFARIKGIVTRNGFGDVEINDRAIKDDLSHGVGPAKAAVIPAIPEVIRKGRQIDFAKNWKGRAYDGYVFAAPVDLDGETVYVAAVVKRTSKNRFYLHEVVDSNGNIIKMGNGGGANQTSLAATGDDAGTLSPLLNLSIPQATPAVKAPTKTPAQLAHEAKVLSGLPIVDHLGPFGRSGLTWLLESHGTVGDAEASWNVIDGYMDLYLAGFDRRPVSQDILPANATPAARRLTAPERLQAYYNGLNDVNVTGQKETEKGKTAESPETLQADGDDAIMKIKKKKLSLEEAKSDGAERQESRENFLARRTEGTDGGIEVFAEDEAVAYGYARRIATQGSVAGEILKELRALGIQGDIVDGTLLKNRGGITTQERVEDAATIGRRRVLVNATIHGTPMNIAGHEAFHVWNGTDATAAFRKAIQENLKYTSPEFLAYQEWIAVRYFGEEVELADEQRFRIFEEEFCAYIAGDIHDGVSDDRLRPMFRDFEAVKAAWVALVKTQTSVTGAMDTAHPRESAGDIQRIYSRPPQSADDAQATGQKKMESSADESTLQSAEEKGTIGETALVQLTDAETSALVRYKSSESYKLNAAIRDGQDLTPEQRQMKESLDAVLPKLPIYRGRVYRHLSFDLQGPEAMEAFLAEHQPGSSVRYPAYTSASTLSHGYPVEGDLTVTIVIESESARDMNGFGNNFENEVLFSRSGRFLVERVETDVNGKTIIYVREVESDG